MKELFERRDFFMSFLLEFFFNLNIWKNFLSKIFFCGKSFFIKKIKECPKNYVEILKKKFYAEKFSRLHKDEKIKIMFSF